MQRPVILQKTAGAVHAAGHPLYADLVGIKLILTIL
jgi:hypothetical protein